MKNKSIIEKMSLEEKANLTSGKNFWETQNYDHLGIPSIFLADGPHGIRKQEAAADHLGLNQSLKATCFPTAVTMSCSWNLDLAKELGECLSKEAINQKVNILLGPGLNIKRNPRCGRNFEYFSEDPYLSGKMASRYIQGIQKYGISGCAKHFACNSQELRRMNIDSIVDERALREIYLTNFEIAIKEGKPKTIMSAYNPINGSYASENIHLCNEILHDEWKYNGVIVSDWGGMNDRALGIKANNELEMPTSSGDGAKDIINAINDGQLEESQLDNCVDRLLTLINDTTKAIKESNISVDFENHHAIAQKCAEESIVLLENNGILPLKADQKIAFIGKFFEEPRYQGAGSSVVNPYKLDKMSDIINEYKIHFAGYEKGFDFGRKTNKK